MPSSQKTAVYLLWLMRHNFGHTKQMFGSKKVRWFFSSQATKKTICAVGSPAVQASLCITDSEFLFCVIGKVSTSPALKVCGR